MKFRSVFENTGVRNVILIFLVTLAAYAGAFSGSFQFDDYNVIVDNPRVHAWPAWWHDIGAHGIRPLLKLTYVSNWTAGWGAAGFLVTNFLIHVVNACLAYGLTRRFLQMQKSGAAQDTWVPLFSAMLFALHPMLTEAVTYICGRSSSLMMLFYLAGMLAYANGRDGGKAWVLHVVVPACMLLALLVKEVAVTFPAALLLWELQGGGTLKQAISRQWVAWSTLLLGLVFFLLHPGYAEEMQSSFSFNTYAGKIATQLLGLLYLLRQWFIPFWPNIDPDLPVLAGFQGLLPHTAIFLGMLVLMLFSWRQRPWLAFALGWTLLHLLPIYLILPRLDVANDRQLYLVAWPLAMAVAMALDRSGLLRRKSLGMLILICLALLTFMRNQDYGNEIALWEATARLSPGKARVQNNLGFAYMQAGRSEEAQHAFETALKYDPAFYRAHYNLMLLGRRGM